MRSKRIFFALILGIVFLIAGATAITADFSANPTSGNAPLTVQFTDTSVGSPTGWAWFFGDENYSAKWQMMVAKAAWSGRNGQSSVVLPDGSIVLMGGYPGNGKNEVWRSTDAGATWTLMNPNAPWAGRSYFGSVVLPDGSIVIMGGTLYFTDVWRSTDKGATWTQMTKDAGWSPRSQFGSVALSDGSIVIMGGPNKNDVWRSTDNGATWLEINTNAEWTARNFLNCVALPDGNIVLLGGGAKNDVWRSTDKGETWTLMSASAPWPPRTQFNSVAMPDGSIVQMAGGTNGGSNDVWRSTDEGATWTELTANADWATRAGPSSVALPDGSIVLMGGTSHGYFTNDVWRLKPAGSTLQNPEHTYTSGGNYQVTLQAYNADGYNEIVKTGFITVSGGSGGTQTNNGNPAKGSSSNQSSMSNSQSPGLPLPLILIGIIILLCLLGGAYYIMKSRKSPSPIIPLTNLKTGGNMQSPSPTGTHHDVFISHSSKDKPVADAICNYLESREIRCWIAPRDILPGMQYQESIINAIDSSSIMVLVFSSDSNQSPHVLTEVNEAMSNNIIIIPFRVEDIQPSKSMKYLIGVPHWLDAITPPMEQHIQKLAETIKTLIAQKKEKEKNQ